jgi:hypothetical protein
MKAKALILAGLCGLVVALALPASGIAASQPTVEPFNFTVGPFANNLSSWWGCPQDLEGTDVITATGVNVYDGQVYRINAYHFTDTFTNPATGKWVEQASGTVDKLNFVDNGDGTISEYVWFSGNQLIRQSNGAPIGGTLAGHSEGVLTIDAATGDVIGFQLLQLAGQFPDQSPDAICGQLVAALT